MRALTSSLRPACGRLGRALGLTFGALAAIPAAAQLAAPPQRSAPAAPRPEYKSLEAPRLPTPATGAPAAAQPRQFALAPGERAGWGLIIGQAGTVDVLVRAGGSTVVVSLRSPSGQALERTGAGDIRLQAQVTEQDIRAGQIWLLGVRHPGTPTAPSGSSGRPLRVEAPVLVQGTVAVTHPPGDTARAQAEIQQRAQKMKTVSAAPLDAVVAREASVETQRADAAQTQRQRVALEQLRGTLAGAQPLQKSSASAATAAPATSQVQGGNATTLLQRRALPTATAPASGTVAPVGSQGSPATVAIPLAIASLSVGRGAPGDPVLINGSGFGAQGGTVRIAVAAGQSLAAPIVVWSETAILAKVPDASGIAAPYRGQLSVERAGSASAATAFEFVPATETRVLAPQLGQFSVGGPGGVSTNICHPACSYGVDLGNLLFGHKGEDVFFSNVRLKNGWRVAQVGLGHVSGQSFSYGIWKENSADARMMETRVGTDSPYVKVGWWHDAFSSVAYWPRIVIEGPKGVPHL